MEINLNNRLNIYVNNHLMTFYVADHSAADNVAYEPYTVRSGISMAANMREAFKHNTLLNRGYQSARLIVDTPTLLIPQQEFDETQVDVYYHHAITGYTNHDIKHEALPNIHAIVLFAVNKDLHLVVKDHFSDIQVSHLMPDIWNKMVSKSYNGNHRRLFAFFRDRKVDIFSFDKNRFRFSNTFNSTHAQDAVYFILNVWTQLAFDTEKDELHLIFSQSGFSSATEQENRKEIVETLDKFIRQTVAEELTIKDFLTK